MTSSTVQVVDELSGERVTVEAGSAREVIDRRLLTADHPRRDFRARPLTYELVDGDGRVLPAEATVDGLAEVRLVGSEAADVRHRRDRWLADIENRGRATTSISTTTHLALIERTGSRLHDVGRLRTQLSATEPQAPILERRRFGLGRAALVAGLALIAVVGGTALWWLGATDNGEDGVPAAAGGAPPPEADEDEEALALPVDLELTLASGERHETMFVGRADQSVTILMLAPVHQGGNSFLDPQLELWDAEGDQLGYNDDRADLAGRPLPAQVNGLNSRIDVTLPADGVYTVVSSDLSGEGTGSYRLLIEEGGPGGDGFSGFEGEAEMMGQPRVTVEMAEEEVMLSDPMDPDQLGCGFADTTELDELPFEITFVPGCEIVPFGIIVDVEGFVVTASAESESGGDPIMWVVDDEGEVIAANDDAGGGLGSLIEVELDPGHYEVLVGNLAGQGERAGQGAGIELTIVG